MSVRHRSHVVAGIATVLLLVSAMLLASQVRAEEVQLPPELKLLVGFPQGGTTDLLSRLLAERLAARLGLQVQIDNRFGAAGRHAIEAVRVARPDGRTLVIANIAQLVIAPLLYPELTYDPLQDLVPVGKIADYQIALATGKRTAAGNFTVLRQWLRAHPDKAVLGHPGTGTIPHLYGAVLARDGGLALKAVPYRGGVAIAQALQQGELAAGWGGIADLLAHHQAGKVRIVAVSGAARSPVLPDVPTFGELAMPGLSGNGWIGVLGPKGLDPALVRRFHIEFSAVLSEAGAVDRLLALGFLPADLGPQAFRASIASELNAWRPLIQKYGLKP